MNTALRVVVGNTALEALADGFLSEVTPENNGPPVDIPDPVVARKLANIPVSQPVGLRRFAKRPVIPFIARAEPEKSRSELIKEAALQVMAMGDVELAMLKAGVVPPQSTASTLVELVDGNIRDMAWQVVAKWKNRGVDLDFEEVLEKARSSFPLFLKKRKWKPEKSSPVHYGFRRGYFRAFLERALATEHPLLQQHLRAEKNGLEKDPMETRWRARVEEIERRNLVPFKESPHADADFSIWDRIGINTTDNENQVFLAIATALYDFLTDSAFSTIEKEVLLLRARFTMDEIGVIYGVKGARIQQISSPALLKWAFYLKPYLEKEEFSALLSLEPARRVKVLTKMLSSLFQLEDLYRIAVRAGFKTPVLRKTILGGIRKEEDFAKLTQQALEILAGEAEEFVLEGSRDYFRDIYRLEVIRPDQAVKNSQNRFSITIARKILQNGKIVFDAVRIKGLRAYSVIQTMARSGLVLIDPLLTVSYWSRRSRGTGIKTKQDLATIKKDKIVELSRGKKHFVFVGSFKGEKVDGFNVLASELSEKSLGGRFSLSVDVVTEGENERFVVQKGMGWNWRGALELLEKSEQFIIKSELRAFAQQPAPRGINKRHRFKSREALRTMTRDELDALRNEMHHFVLIFSKSSVYDLAGFDALSPAEAAKKGRLYSKVEVKKSNGPFPFEIVGYSSSPSRTREVVEDLKATGLFALI